MKRIEIGMQGRGTSCCVVWGGYTKFLGQNTNVQDFIMGMLVPNFIFWCFDGFWLLLQGLGLCLVWELCLDYFRVLHGLNKEIQRGTTKSKNSIKK